MTARNAERDVTLGVSHDDLRNNLPVPLGRMVPRATEALAEAMVATSRIEAFLNLAEDSASRSRLTDQIKSLGSPQGRSGGEPPERARRVCREEAMVDETATKIETGNKELEI